MESIDLKRLNLTIEELRYTINFIAQKRGISTEKLLSTIKPNLKHKNNEILTTRTHQKAAKTHQKVTKIHQEAKKNTSRSKKKYIKKQKKYIKKQKKYIKQQKHNKNQLNYKI